MTFKEAIDHIKETHNISMTVIAEILGITYASIYMRYNGKAKGKLRLTTAIKFYKKYGVVIEPYTQEVLEDIIKARS